MTNTTRFCQECGTAIVPDSQFCESCGTPVLHTTFANFTRVRELFDQVLAVEPSRRKEWLQVHCVGQPDVLSEVLGMLPGLNDSFLAAPAIMPPSALIPPAGSPLKPPSPAAPSSRSSDGTTGLSIGPYRLVRELGRGGMGVVYLAVRDDGTFRKYVALKLLLRDQVSPEFIQRFKQERQVLAALDHPNIARILDGGDAPDGMPYYVMEYVEGLALNKFCDDQKLGLSARIRIFQQVCESVQYLHNNSILHRDLKPANILVSSDGVVKLLDFGIAKVVGAAALSSPDVTSIQGTPMTPTYASPEQIQGLTLQRTSDIYALGAILYLLLTGHTPYRDWETKKAQLASQKGPPPPSANIREELRATPESTAQLRKAMLGELDSIVLMALRYDPKERYQSAAELAEDLQRFLSGHDVAAHRNTVARRSVKLFRRKRMMLAVAAALLLTAGFGAWQWRRVEVQKTEVAAREAQFRALIAKLEAGVDAAKPEAEQIKDLQALTKAFTSEFPKLVAAQPELSTQHKELLSRGLRYLDRFTASPPKTVDLGLGLAEAYEQIAALQASVPTGKPADALPTYQRAEQVLNACPYPPDDNRVPEKLAVVRKRIAGIGGLPAVPVSNATPAEAAITSPQPAMSAIAVSIPPPGASIVPAPKPATASPKPIAPIEANRPAPAPRLPEQATSAALAPGGTPIPSSPPSAEVQDRVVSAESRIMIAEQTIEPLRKTLEAKGQSLNPSTLSDMTTMRVRLTQAKRQLAAGNEEAARENLVAAQALADRVLKMLGR